MKLVFNKNDDLEISVTQKNGDEEKEFNYVEMIKDLISTKSLEEPEMNGDFTDSEVDSIKTMIKHINTDVSEFYSDNEG